jgi:hypothetical protein
MHGIYNIKYIEASSDKVSKNWRTMYEDCLRLWFDALYLRKEVPAYGKNVGLLAESSEAKGGRVDVFSDRRRKHLCPRLEDVFIQLFILLNYRTPLCKKYSTTDWSL